MTHLFKTFCAAARRIALCIAQSGSWRSFALRIALLASVAWPHIAHGQRRGGLSNPAKAIAESVVEFSLGGLGKLVVGFLSIIMTALQWVVEIAVKFLTAIIHISDFQNVAIVNLGWHITLDFVNLLFILILLLIGFATIFRMETYGIKALLPRLIIVALFINFSKVIAGIVIDVGNLLTQFFLTPMGSPENLGIALQNLLNLSKAYQVQWDEINKISNDISKAVAIWGQIVFAQLLGVVAMAVVAIGMLLYGGVFVVRIVVLWLLVIVAPLAWISSILPGTRRHFQMWWSNFIKWVMIAPIMVFFLFLLAAMGKEAGRYGLTGFVDSQGDKLKQTNNISTFADDPRFLLQYAIVMGFIFAGPIAASQMGAAGAAAAIGIASAGQRWVLNQTGRGALGAARYGKQRTGERIAPFMQRAGTALSRVPILSKIPGFAALARVGVSAGERNREKIQEDRKQFAPMSTEALLAYSRTLGSLNQNRRVAAALEISNRNDLQYQSTGDQAQAAKEMSYAASLSRTRNDQGTLTPLLASQMQLVQTPEEMQRAMTHAARNGNLRKYTASTISAIQNSGTTIGGKSLNDAFYEQLRKELGESPEAIKRLGEQVGKEAREAMLEGLKKSFIQGNAQEQFNARNSDFREAFVQLDSTRFREAVVEHGQDANGNATEVVNEDFGKSIARSMSGQQLEKFYATNIANEEALITFENLRGTHNVEELEKAIRKSGQHTQYTADLERRLSDGYLNGTLNQNLGRAPTDQELLEERYNDSNSRRSALYARLTGNVEKAFAVDDLDKGLEWQKQGEAAVTNFITGLNNEAAEELGKKANKFESTRLRIATDGLADKLPNFLQGMEQKYRANVVRLAKDTHSDEKIQANKTFMNSLRRNFYISSIARTSGVDLGKQKREDTEYYDEREAVQNYQGAVTWAGRDLSRLTSSIDEFDRKVRDLGVQMADASKRPTFYEAGKILPNIEKDQQGLEAFEKELGARIDGIVKTKGDLPEDKLKEVEAYVQELEQRAARLKPITGALRRHTQEVRDIAEPKGPTPAP